MYFISSSQLQNIRKCPMLMKKEDSLLLVIDVQERLAPAMDNPREVITGCAKLLGVARELSIPCIITEQYPQGLGQTMVDLRQEAAEGTPYLAKLEFSCLQNEQIRQALEHSGKKQIVIAGVETHICVVQTAIELQAAGYEVFVVSNACSSRKPVQHVLGLQRLMHNHIEVVSIEMAIFEWLQKAGSPKFKEITRKYVM